MDKSRKLSLFQILILGKIFDLSSTPSRCSFPFSKRVYRGAGGYIKGDLTMKVKENNITANYGKQEYIKAIDKIMAGCDEIELLDFVYQILVKSV